LLLIGCGDLYCRPDENSRRTGMKIIAERQYLLDPGEKAKVSVTATGTVNNVNFDIDGQGGGPLADGQVITVSKPAGGVRKLTLLFTFSGSSGGQFVVTIKGDNGGSDTDVVDQGAFGIPGTARSYLFQ